MKVLGAVEIYTARFQYAFDTVFNAVTYLSFLKHSIAPRYRRRGAILVQDNASYHKEGEVWRWYAENRDWLEVHNLPPYSPEFNPTERAVHYPHLFTFDGGEWAETDGGEAGVVALRMHQYRGSATEG
jgi:transposase